MLSLLRLSLLEWLDLIEWGLYFSFRSESEMVLNGEIITLGLLIAKTSGFVIASEPFDCAQDKLRVRSNTCTASQMSRCLRHCVPFGTAFTPRSSAGQVASVV